MRSPASDHSTATDASAKEASRPSASARKSSTRSKRTAKAPAGKPVIGWREWVGLPDLCVPPIKAKIDTGARTSALHAFRIRPFDRDGKPFVEFFVHPVQHRRRPEVRCEARVLERRKVTSSTGHSEWRYVIRTTAELGRRKLKIELSLANRDEMGFRMLIGREAVRGKFIVDPGRSYCMRRLDDG